MRPFGTKGPAPGVRRSGSYSTPGTPIPARVRNVAQPSSGPNRALRLRTVNFRSKAVPVVAWIVALVPAAGCGGGDKSYKEGTPAATGQAPDCSVAPLDLVNRTLKRELSGPVQDTRQGGVTCTYPVAKGGGGGTADQVQLNSNADKASMDIIRNGLKQAKNKVNKIDGYGDEAFASTVYGYATVNNFAVRKGKVSVVIISTAEYDEIRKLMEEVLDKL